MLGVRVPPGPPLCYNVRMYEDIHQHMQRPLEERQKHILLDEPCIEIGGHSSSCKALLAHYIFTTIPKGKQIHVCHLCGNGKCTNVKHLYWGTPSENAQDAKRHGAKSVTQRTKEKYGEEAYREMRRQWSSKGGKASRK